MANLGDPITKKLTTGRLFLRVGGEDNYRDFGNVVDHKYAPKITRAEHMRSSGGFKRTDISLASAISPAYQFILDEHTPQLEQLRMVGSQGDDTTQNAGNTVDEELTDDSLQGRTYFAGKMGLSNVVVKVGAAVKVLDTDYAVDLGSGAVTVLNGGGIADGSTVTVSYTAAEVVQHTFSSFDDLMLQGDVRYIEYDQFSQVPRAIHEFSGQVYVTDWGENKGEYNQVTVEAVPLTNPVVKTRAD